MRRHLYGPAYGIPLQDLSRRWAEDHWSHTSKFGIIKGKLYMRIVSSSFVTGGLTQSEERLLLYSREDYTPYFSACAHWRDGLLMEICKCALSHVPVEQDFGGLKKVAKVVEDRINQKSYDPSSIVTLCPKCRPMRRCPECPSEYLVEMKRMEDRALRVFKRAICVTRWCELGDCGTAGNVEWAAVNGEGGGYDSIKTIGKRAISGTFESYFTEDTMPGQRLLSLNPKMEKHSDVDDPAWY